MSKRLFILLLLNSIVLGCASRMPVRRNENLNRSFRAVSTPSLNADYGRLPLHFEANQGQTDDRVKFVTRGTGYAMFLTGTEAVLVLSSPAAPEKNDRRFLPRMKAHPPSISRSVLRMTFAGANGTPLVEGRDQLPGKVNYFKGTDPANWQTNIPTYERVRYENLYPGIDLQYYGIQRQLEYDFVVQPGADPHRITLDFKGAGKIEVDRNGDLVLQMGDTEVRQRKPFIYQEVNGERREISGGYVFRERSRIGFRIATYDSSRPLIIDPAVLFYSTYLGGSDIDSGSGIAVDSAGNAYLTGYVRSTDFPTTVGAFQPNVAGDYDAFVTKLNPTGSGLVYSTYLGGSSFDIGNAITLDAGGNVYVAGPTDSTDFPTTAGAFATNFNGGFEDAFVTKLNATGSALVYSTYLGGDSDDGANATAVDAAGNAVVAGFTSSTNFPTSVLAFDTTFNGGPEDGFVTKLNSTGSALIYSTYLGGSDDDFIADTVLDAAGNAHVAGATTSSDYPTTVGAFDTTFNGDYDGVVTKLNATASGLLYSTFLGGSMGESSNGLTVDAMGSAYVGGSTNSTDFPTTAGAFQPTLAGLVDMFITKLNVAGSGVVYSTYLGGSSEDFGGAVAVDTAGNVYAPGATFSSDFPITAGAFQPTYAGNIDGVVTKINPAGSELVYSSYLGGNDLDSPQDIALDSLPNPNAYVVGATYSIDFPTTAGAFDTTINGDRDAFVAKIAEGNPAAGPFTERVTGGGTIDVVGGIGTFSFMIQRSSTGTLSGHLQYFNHASGARVRSDDYISLLIAGNSATFDGDCTVDGSTCTFTVNVTDNGEPGTTDTFTITVSGGPTEGGPLRSGNILIQQ
jgi:hypothetical protein